MTHYYEREGVEHGWREVARYPLRDVVLLPHVHVGDEVVQSREHINIGLDDCDYCPMPDDAGKRIDTLLFVALWWLSAMVEPERLHKIPQMNQHGEFSDDWFHPHRVRQIGDPWDTWFVIEEETVGVHPVDDYEAALQRLTPEQRGLWG